jgi:hypothetical protein
MTHLSARPHLSLRNWVPAACEARLLQTQASQVPLLMPGLRR